MVAGFKHHLGCPEGGLSRQQGGDVTRQPDLNAGLRQRFQDDVDKCRSAPGKACNSVQMFLFHYYGAAHGGEEQGGEVQLLLGGVTSTAESSDAGSQHRWS